VCTIDIRNFQIRVTFLFSDIFVSAIIIIVQKIVKGKKYVKFALKQTMKALRGNRGCFFKPRP
jgi:hypothetical protein